jgi:alpha-D-xyloside xylohydrolase
VYLPQGAQWSNSWTGQRHDGGTWVEVDAPIDRIPVFARDEAAVPVAGSDYGGQAEEPELLGSER